MRILLLGNCQMTQLDQLLRTSSDYISTEIIGAFSDISIQSFCAKIDRADYVVSRVYGSGCPAPFMRLQNLKRLAGPKLIVVPTIVNYALFPDFAYVSDISVSGCPYIPVSSLNGYVEGISSNDAVKNFNSAEYHNERGYDLRLDETVKELDSLEAISDVKVADEVRSATFNSRSFYSHNHPMLPIVDHIKRQVLDIIGISENRKVPIGLIKDAARYGPILPISDAVAEKFDIYPNNSLIAKLPTSPDASDEWIDMQEMMSRCFGVMYQREHIACQRTGLPFGRLHPVDRRLLIEFQPDMRLHLNQYADCPDHSERSFYRVIGNNSIEVFFSNDTDESIRFSGQNKLALRVQLWRGSHCLSIDYATYYVNVQTVRPKSTISFLVPVPSIYLADGDNGELHVRFGLLQEGVEWFDYALALEDDHNDLPDVPAPAGYGQGGVLAYE